MSDAWLMSAEALSAGEREGKIESAEGRVFNIQIRGVLGNGSPAVSYSSIAEIIALADASPKVSAVMLDVDSNGGAINGILTLRDAIARAQKPVWVYYSGTGASAAYFAFSGADLLIASATSRVGSLGAAYTRDDDDGKKPIVSRRARRKRLPADSEELASSLQAYADSVEDLFLSAAGADRGMDADALAEAGRFGDMLMAPEALSAGLIDHIADSPAAALEWAVAHQEEATMAIKQNQAADLPEGMVAVAQERLSEMEAALTGSAKLEARMEALEAKLLKAEQEKAAALTAQAEAAEQLAQLKAAAAERDVEDLIGKAVREGRLAAGDTAAQEKWAARARSLGLEATAEILADLPQLLPGVGEAPQGHKGQQMKGAPTTQAEAMAAVKELAEAKHNGNTNAAWVEWSQANAELVAQLWNLEG